MQAHRLTHINTLLSAIILASCPCFFFPSPPLPAFYCYALNCLGTMVRKKVRRGREKIVEEQTWKDLKRATRGRQMEDELLIIIPSVCDFKHNFS